MSATVTHQRQSKHGDAGQLLLHPNWVASEAAQRATPAPLAEPEAPGASGSLEHHQALRSSRRDPAVAMSSPPVWGRLPDVSVAAEDDERRRVKSRGKIFQRFRWNELPGKRFRWSVVAEQCIAHRRTLASVAVLLVLLLGGTVLMRIVLHGSGTSDEHGVDGGAVVANGQTSQPGELAADHHPATAQVPWRGGRLRSAAGAATNSSTHSESVADARFSSSWPQNPSVPPWAAADPRATTSTESRDAIASRRQTVGRGEFARPPTVEPGAAANRSARVELPAGVVNQRGMPYQPGSQPDGGLVLPNDHPRRLPHINQRGSTGTFPRPAGRYGPGGSTWMAEDVSQPPRGEPTRVAELTGTIETTVEGTHRR